MVKKINKQEIELEVVRNFNVKGNTSFQGAFGDAPVNGVRANVTIDMTNANADLLYTAVGYSADGNNYTVTHVDPSANDAELSVSISGYDITVSLATGAAGAITSTATLVTAAINTDAEISAVVSCAADGTGAGLVTAKAETSLANGVTCTDGNVGAFKILTAGTTAYLKTAEQVWKKFTLSAL